jgi:hypothetical protein
MRNVFPDDLNNIQTIASKFRLYSRPIPVLCQPRAISEIAKRLPTGSIFLTQEDDFNAFYSNKTNKQTNFYEIKNFYGKLSSFFSTFFIISLFLQISHFF